MKTLLVSRATGFTELGCFDRLSGSMVFSQEIAEGRGSGRGGTWVADLSSLLAGSGVDLSDVDGYVTSVGPGSFSGIRGGLACLQGMGLVTGAPVLGVSTACVIAWHHFSRVGGDGLITVVGDARRGTLWACAMRCSDDGIVRADGSALSHTADDFVCGPVGDVVAGLMAGSAVVTVDYDRLSRLVPGLIGAEPTVADLYGAYVRVDALAEPKPIYLHPAVAK